MSYHQLTDSFRVAADLERVWAFFSSAENLPKITPAKMNFTILTPRPITIAQDSVLDYSISLGGVNLKWKTLIIDFSPPHQFIDLQLKGPYTLWHHQHTFQADGDGVICRDRVIYKLPMGLIGRAVHAATVRRQLLEIFTHRRRVIGEHLGAVVPLQAQVEIKRVG